MGFADKLKDLFGKGKSAVADNADKVRDGIEKAGDVVDEKTGGKYADKVDMAQDKATEAVDKLEGEASE